MKIALRVVTEFQATAFAIAGQVRLFQPGDAVSLELGQQDELVTIEADHGLYIVERDKLLTCCISNSMGTLGGPP